jgi:hypothetical protein
MSNQTAELHLLTKARASTAKRRMVFYRDDKHVFQIDSNSDALYKLRGMWIEGATMGEIALAAKEMGVDV